MPSGLQESLPAIQGFLREATVCAEQELGFAALCITFPVIMCVGEALLSSQHSAAQGVDRDKAAIGAVAEYLEDQTWYIKARKPGSLLTSNELRVKLYEIRNSLSHQVSLPNGLCLINDIKQKKAITKLGETISDGLAVREFVSAVSDAIARIVHSNPDAIVDAKPIRLASDRSPAQRRTVNLSPGFSVGASAPGIPGDLPVENREPE